MANDNSSVDNNSASGLTIGLAEFNIFEELKTAFMQAEPELPSFSSLEANELDQSNELQNLQQQVLQLTDELRQAETAKYQQEIKHLRTTIAALQQQQSSTDKFDPITDSVRSSDSLMLHRLTGSSGINWGDQYPQITTTILNMCNGPSEVDRKLQSSHETIFVYLTDVTATTVIKFLASYKVYAKMGAVNFAYTIDELSGARAAIMARLGMTFTEFNTYDKATQIKKVQDAYDELRSTPSELLGRLNSSCSTTTITTVDQIERSSQIFLKLLNDYPTIAALPQKELKTAFRQNIPLDVLALNTKRYPSAAKIVDADFTKILLCAKIILEARELNMLVTKATSRFQRFQRNEPGSLTAAKAMFEISSAGFVSVMGRCFQCNLPGHQVGALECPNTANLDTHCGPCVNKAHPLLSKLINQGVPECSRQKAFATKSERPPTRAAIASLFETVQALKAELVVYREAKVHRALVVQNNNHSSNKVHIDSGCNSIL
jgi:hypothetical protein